MFANSMQTFGAISHIFLVPCCELWLTIAQEVITGFSDSAMHR